MEDKDTDAEDLRPDKDDLARQHKRADDKGKTNPKGKANPNDRPADPSEHMDEDEAKGRTMRDLDKRRPE